MGRLKRAAVSLMREMAASSKLGEQFWFAEWGTARVIAKASLYNELPSPRLPVSQSPSLQASKPPSLPVSLNPEP